jgi:thiamine biosynthesis lipoprotein
MHTRCLLVVSFLVAAQWCTAGEPSLTRFTFSEPHMGTQFKIIVYAPDETKAREATAAGFKRIAQLDQMMSDYRPSSELMYHCRHAGGPPTRVSPDLFTVLARAQGVSRLSDGAFDVTVGPVVHLWRRARKSEQLPDPQKLAEARALVGYQNMRLDAGAHTVQLLKRGMMLDLGGISKGYAADAALKVLKEHGIDRALVAAGGDIAVSGPPVGAEDWTIGIAPLEDPNRKPRHYLFLHNAAVSTSGDSEQYLEIGGKRYSHILDPRTGEPLTGRQSVTVVARHGLWADPLTKVVSVLGTERGLPIIDRVEGAAAFVVRQSSKGHETFASKEWVNLRHRDNSSGERSEPNPSTKR